MKNQLVKFKIVLLLVIGLCNTVKAQNRNITISSHRNSDNTVDITYKKELPGSYYLTLIFSRLQNCYPTNFEGVIKHSSGNLVTLGPIKKSESVGFSYTSSYIRGVPNPKVDSLFNYRLPFNKGESIKIMEATNIYEEYFGSEKPSKWKSYIVDRTNADTIYAIRKGIIVEIIDEFQSNPLNTYNYTSKLNSITIEHLDGTYVTYKGFRKKPFLVKLGQTVYPTTKLGALSAFNETTFRLYFHIYYLIDDNLKSKTKTSLKIRINRSEFLTPYFNTTVGKIKLEDMKTYTVDFNETMLVKEFTRKEKKKYKKKPKIFN